MSPYAAAFWTVVATVGSAGWQVYQYREQAISFEEKAKQEKTDREVAVRAAEQKAKTEKLEKEAALLDAAELRKDAKSEAALNRRVETQQPFLKRKLDTFFEAIQVAAHLTDEDLEPKSPKWREAANRFWQLRWGELEMVGDPGVRDAARRVGQQILETEFSPERERHDLRWAVECLADELRLATEHAWGIDRSLKRDTALPFGDPVSKLPSGCTLGQHPPVRLNGMRPLMAPGNLRAGASDEPDYFRQGN